MGSFSDLPPLETRLAIGGPNGGFVEKIDYREIEMTRTIGQGSFGVVNHGKWRGMDVAVKIIQGEQERRAFEAELLQLSRVSHPNIVQLFGAGAVPNGPVLLLMEYAEGGSLYNVLHCETPQGVRAEYAAAHAISWALQTAKGVAYLHGLKPRPVVHRDLKPPNLLLIDGGRVLKICDFGTACECQTYMTNAKGSAAWMAPEVFEGSDYTEKCDIFSWGIILWEVLTRNKPFDEIGESAYRIMWAVHEGQRPPLIAGCPKRIEDLMVSCWNQNPTTRPAMDDVVTEMTELQQFFPGHDIPLQYSGNPSMFDSPYATGCSESLTSADHSSGRFSILASSSEELSREHAKFLTLLTVDNQEDRGDSSTTGQMRALRIDVGVSEIASLPSNALITKSPGGDVDLNAPIPTLALDVPSHSLQNKRHSADFSQIFLPAPGPAPAVPPRPVVNSDGRALGHRRSSSYGSSITTDNWPFFVRPVPMQPITPAAYDLTPHLDYTNFIDEAYHMLPPDLSAIPPDESVSDSVAIFEDHKRLAADYMKVQTEISLLQVSLTELRRELKEEESHATVLDSQGQASLMKEYQKLLDEKESCEALYKCLEKQLDAAKSGKFLS